MPDRSILLPLLALLFTATAYCADEGPISRDAAISIEAVEHEQRGEWLHAARIWEYEMLSADNDGASDRCIAFGERAVAAWQKVRGSIGLRGAAFAVGVISKRELSQGRLVSARLRALEELSYVEKWASLEAGWKPKLGKPVPKNVSLELLEAWLRAQRNAAEWLDAQGRTIEAIDLLTAAEQTARLEPSRRPFAGFYHRKLISTRAGHLKFLGYQERAIANLQLLEDTAPLDARQPEWARRLNLPYFSSQFYGPRPEYLDAARAVWREMNATGQSSRESRRLLAKMAYAYGETGANIADLESLVTEARQAGEVMESIYAQRDFAVVSAQAGNRVGVEEALHGALQKVRTLGVKRSEPTLYREYGEFLLAEGRAAEALQMLREAARLTRAFGWDQHLPALLRILMDAQAAVGDRKALEQTLRELDALVAAGKLTPHRAFLAHCARARALQILGRAGEAEEALRAAKAIADQGQLNEYQRFALAWAKDVPTIAERNRDPETKPEATSGIVDLQPVETMATGAEGQNLSARIRLSNATDHATTGTLTFSGPGISLKETVDHLAVTVIPGESAVSDTREVTIPAGDALPIDVETSAIKKRGSLVVEWKSGDGKTSRAAIHFEVKRPGESQDALALVSNRSVAFSNPFYAVHLFHTLSVPSGSTRDVHVKASAPCRVEFLDARTGALLAVDANGDGKFDSRGDSIADDANQDGFPELASKAETGIAEVEILVYPLAGASPLTRDLRVDLFGRDGESWAHVGSDTLKPAARR